MQIAERRTGLRRFLPFLSERKPKGHDLTAEQVKARRLARYQDRDPVYEVEQELVVPASLFKDKMAEVLVMTQLRDGVWTSIAAAYNADSTYNPDISNENRVIGKVSFKADSLIGALEKEVAWIEDSISIYGWNPHNEGLSESIKDTYNQRIYKVVRD
ncbi:MAG: hypothetical protein A2798_00675 [Candidatus Levybacteria bacterium RIFCSPHIGHO2_01_FULL_37_17]|nr:MAG: hypothetical protein A2798_00675 [Candidatus Levybacteria bacterium RIFCSPHIGHO2_01_FULL_37_17]OGH36968.1 MAG: hypothetical protein A2959_01535 [Candidatus Levybacteria bacterium RIFCSPLOWO2_01_FULL_38_23]